MPANEGKFYTALENIFTGANIEGEGGYVNLLKIKSAYYKKILAEFQKQVEENDIIKDFKEDFFDRLFTFFERYFSESGSVYFVKTASWQKVYEQVYTDSKDVVLFWKTNMLYYVKSDIMFKNMDISVKDDTAVEHKFFFDCGNLKNKQNNEKKEIIFAYEKTEDGKHLFKVSYSENGTKTKSDDIRKAIKKAGIAIGEDTLDKAFAAFKKQTSVDFFINKDAKKFLTEQLDMYLHQILLDEKNEFDTTRLTQLKTVKDFSLKIIDFISQFEDELVRIWNKPKFVLNSHYVITMDKLTPEIIGKLKAHSGWKEQTKEWKELGMSDGDKLPIDTKYFNDLEIEILSLFDDLDEVLDGRLIHSENYQALNTLKDRYREKVQCIYIDPPYNSPSSEIAYLNDYKHSSWITLMENRLDKNTLFLNSVGSTIIAIDKYEQDNLSLLSKLKFPNFDIVSVAIEHNKKGTQGDHFSYSNEFAVFVISNKLKELNEKIRKKEEWEYSNLRNWGGESERTDAKNCFYPIYIQDNKIIGWGQVIDDNIHPNTNEEITSGNVEVFNKNKSIKITATTKNPIIAVYPIDDNNIERKWRYAFQSIQVIFDYLRIEKSKKNSIQIEMAKYSDQFKTLWASSLYNAGDYGTTILTSMGLNDIFGFPKSIHTVKDCIYSVTDKNSIVLDYFAGSGTTAHAVIKLNKDGGHRKYMLVEVNGYFNTVILPRIKKVCYSDKWKDGKALEGGVGVSQFFKYYELEQYEQTLSKMKYSEIASTIFDETRPFANYIFLTDSKLSDVLEIKDGKVNLDFDKLYENIDFPETISLIKGKAIKKITANSVILESNETIRYDYKNFTNDEKIDFVKMLKPLLWWGRSE